MGRKKMPYTAYKNNTVAKQPQTSRGIFRTRILHNNILRRPVSLYGFEQYNSSAHTIVDKMYAVARKQGLYVVVCVMCFA